MNPSQGLSESSEKDTLAPLVTRMFSGSGSQRQTYQKLSGPTARAADSARARAEQELVPPAADTKQPDIRLAIPPDSPAGLRNAELPKSGAAPGSLRGGSSGGSPHAFAVDMEEDSSSEGEQVPTPTAANLRFRGAAHAIRLTRMNTRSRLQESDRILPSPGFNSSAPPTPRFASRPTPNRSGPLDRSPRATVPKSGPIAPQEDDPFTDDDILPNEPKPNKRMSCFLFTQLVVTVLLLAGVFVTAVVDPPRKDKWLDLEIWKWLLLALVLLSGRYIASWLVKLLVRVIERNFLLKNRVLYFVYGLRKSVANCLWLTQVLVVWFIFYDPKASSAGKLDTISKILVCLQITFALAVFKVLIVKVAANGFHRRAYFERIQEALFRQFLLEQLSRPSSVITTTGENDSFPNGDHSKGGLKRGFGSDVESWLKLHPGTPSPKTDKPVSDGSPDGANHVGDSNHVGAPSDAEQRRPDSNGDVPETSGARPGTGAWDAATDARPSADDSPHSLRSVRVPTPGKEVKSSIPIEAQKLQYLTSETVSAYGLKKLVKFVRSTKIKTYSSIISHQDESEIDSEFQAKAVAKRIFRNVASPGQSHLTEDDLLRFLDHETADRALSTFEGAERGKITKLALINWVVGIYKERKALALSLDDTKTVVAKLHWVLDVILAAFLVIIYLLVFNISATRLLVIISTWFLPATFVFGTSAKDTFVSLMFLFVRHPYSVGDRIQVDTTQYIVEEMNIMDTTLIQTSDNAKVYYPNNVLAGKPILNFYRSPDQGDSWEFIILAKTPVEKLAAFKERMLAYVESLPQLFYPKASLNLKELEDFTRMRMSLSWQHRINFQEMGERMQRRTKLIMFAQQQMIELGIGLDIGPTGIKLHPDSRIQLSNVEALMTNTEAMLRSRIGQ